MSSSRIEPGNGRVVLHNGGSGDVFSELAASYPLKVLSPQLSGLDVSIVYVLTYGGGLVGGDRTQLDVEVHDGTRLCLLSQVRTSWLLTTAAIDHSVAGLYESLQSKTRSTTLRSCSNQLYHYSTTGRQSDASQCTVPPP